MMSISLFQFPPPAAHTAMRVGRQEKSERSWGWAVGEVHTSQRCLSPWLGGRCQRRQLLLQLPSVRSLWPTDLLSIGTGTSGAARWSTTTVLKEGQQVRVKDDAVHARAGAGAGIGDVRRRQPVPDVPGAVGWASLARLHRGARQQGLTSPQPASRWTNRRDSR